jgi:4-hydroxybenzoate polyprenyltransferase
VSAAFRIICDVVEYRLRRLEMANLAASVALVLVLRLSWFDAALRVGAAFLLNVLAYLSNDYHDVDQDLATGRAPDKTRFLSEHRGAALGAQAGLLALLVAIALAHDPGMLVGALGGAGVCWWYSQSLKRRPWVDVASMTAWGALMPAVSVPLHHSAGLALLGLLAAFSMSFECVQVLRDREEDLAHGVRTTAVVLGVKGTLALLRISIALVVAIAVACVEWRTAIVFALALALPFGATAPERDWNRLRLVFGVGWLATLGVVWWRGELDGVFTRLPLQIP